MECAHHLRDLAVEQNVVIHQPLQVFPLCKMLKRGEVLFLCLCLFVSLIAQTAVSQILFNETFRPIVRTVVADDDLKIFIILPQSALQRKFKELGTVIRRDHDADERQCLFAPTRLVRICQ